MPTTISLYLDRTCFHGQRIETNEQDRSQRCLVVALAPCVVRRKDAKATNLATDGLPTEFGLVFPWGYPTEEIVELVSAFNCCEPSGESNWELVDYAEGSLTVDSRTLALLASGVASLFGQGTRKLGSLELVSGHEQLLSRQDTIQKCGGFLRLREVLFRPAGAKSGGEPPKGLIQAALRIAEVRPGEFCQYPRNLPLDQLAPSTLGTLAAKQSLATKAGPTGQCATLPIGHTRFGSALAASKEDPCDFDCRLWLGKEDFEQWPDR